MKASDHIHRSSVLILLILAMNCCRLLAAAEVSERELRRQLQSIVDQPANTLGRKVRDFRTRLDEYLIVEPAKLKWRGGQLEWSLRRRKKMTAEQRGETLAALDGFLRYALAKTEFQPAEANRIANQSRLSIAAQPYVWDVTAQQFSDAIARAFRDPVQRDKVLQMSREFEVPNADDDFFSIHLYNGMVTWSLTPINQNDPDIFGGRLSPEQVMAILRQRQLRDEAKARRYEPNLRSFLLAALSEIPDPQLGAPLLDPDDASSLPLRFEVLGTAMAAAAAGLPLIKSTAARGAVRRRIDQLEFEGLYAIKRWRPEEDFMSIPQMSIDGPPQLVIDTQAFSGAAVNKLAFSPDGRFLAAAGDVVRIWDLRNGQLTHTLRGQRSWDSSGGCTDLVFKADGRQLLVAAEGLEQSLRVYDLAAPEQIREVHQGHKGHIERLAISRDGQWLATYGVDRRLQIWDWQQRKIMTTFPANDPIDHLSFPTARPNVLAITGNGKYEWMATTDGNTVNQQARSQLEQRLSSATAWPFDGSPHPFAIEVDWTNQRWLIGGYGRQDNQYHYWVGYWNGNDAEPVAVHEHKYFVTACGLSSDGTRAASSDGLGNVYVWDTKTGAVQHEFPSRVKPFYSVRYDREDGQISFGRKPYRAPQWQRNHYGALTQVFDFRQRLVRERTESEPPKPTIQQGGMNLALKNLRNTLQLSVDDQYDRSFATLPFSGSARQQPLWYSFLRGDALGFNNGVILGDESGTLVCLDPYSLVSRQIFMGHTDRIWCASQSGDNRSMVSASGDGTIRVWPLRPPKNWGNLAILADGDGKVHHVFPGTPSARVIRVGDFVRSMDYKPISELRQELVATAKWNYPAGDTVEVELQRGEDIINPQVQLSPTGDIARPTFSVFLSADNKHWVIWTPEGYYDASPGGQYLIGWHVNRGVDRAADFYSVDKFRAKFHKPKIIDALFELGDLTLAIQRVEANKPNGGNNRPPDSGSLIANVPNVKIVEPLGDSFVGVAEVEIVAEVNSPKAQPIRTINILVNGKPFAAKNIELVKEETPTNDFGPIDNAPPSLISRVRRTVTLTRGRNEISVLAANDTAHARSASVWVTYRQNVAPIVQRKLFVLAVGVSKYQENRFDLQFAHKDAEDFAAACGQQANRIYSKVETRVLSDDKATVANIKDSMSWLIKNVTPNDGAILFVSGHGVMDADQDYYLATHELEPDDLFGSCLPWTDVQFMATKIKGTLMLFADTCHAGGIAGLKAIIGNPVHDLARDDVGTFVFASCGSRSLSIERADWENGAFTEALLEIIGSADSDLDDPPDRLLSFSELDHQLDRRVQSLTKKQQRPVSQKPQPKENIDLFALP